MFFVNYLKLLEGQFQFFGNQFFQELSKPNISRTIFRIILKFFEPFNVFWEQYFNSSDFG